VFDGGTGIGAQRPGWNRLLRQRRLDMRFGWRLSSGLQRGIFCLFAEKLLIVLAGDGYAHDVHPDGSAVLAPVSFLPSDSRLSKPTQTPQVTEGEKPRNHASV